MIGSEKSASNTCALQTLIMTLTITSAVAAHPDRVKILVGPPEYFSSLVVIPKGNCRATRDAIPGPPVSAQDTVQFWQDDLYRRMLPAVRYGAELRMKTKLLFAFAAF